jgi:hypothetical protein
MLSSRNSHVFSDDGRRATGKMKIKNRTIPTRIAGPLFLLPREQKISLLLPPLATPFALHSLPFLTSLLVSRGPPPSRANPCFHDAGSGADWASAGAPIGRGSHRDPLNCVDGVWVWRVVEGVIGLEVAADSGPCERGGWLGRECEMLVGLLHMTGPANRERPRS